MSRIFRRDPTRQGVVQTTRIIKRDMLLERRLENSRKADEQVRRMGEWIIEQGMAPGVRVVNLNTGEEETIKEIVPERHVLVLLGHERIFRGRKTTFNPLVFVTKNEAAKEAAG